MTSVFQGRPLGSVTQMCAMPLHVGAKTFNYPTPLNRFYFTDPRLCFIWAQFWSFVTPSTRKLRFFHSTFPNGLAVPNPFPQTPSVTRNTCCLLFFLMKLFRTTQSAPLFFKPCLFPPLSQSPSPRVTTTSRFLGVYNCFMLDGYTVFHCYFSLHPHPHFLFASLICLPAEEQFFFPRKIAKTVSPPRVSS